jgi:hypothetical protein
MRSAPDRSTHRETLKSVGMLSVPPDNREATRAAYELQRAAANLRRAVRGPDAVEELPLTLAHVDQALGELATSTLVLAQAVGEYANPANTSLDDDVLSPEARALRWHLHEVAARLHAAQRSCPSARLWASDLLATRPVEVPAWSGTASS